MSLPLPPGQPPHGAGRSAGTEDPAPAVPTLRPLQSSPSPGAQASLLRPGPRPCWPCRPPLPLPLTRPGCLPGLRASCRPSASNPRRGGGRGRALARRLEVAGKGQRLEPVWLFKGPHFSAASPFPGANERRGSGLADARTRPVTLEYSAEAAHERPRPRPMPVRHARQTMSILTVCVSCVSSGHRTPELGGEGAARDDRMASDSGTARDGGASRDSGTARDGGAAGTLVGASAPVRPAWRALLFQPKADGSHVWEGPSDASHMQTARFGLVWKGWPVLSRRPSPSERGGVSGAHPCGLPVSPRRL